MRKSFLSLLLALVVLGAAPAWAFDLDLSWLSGLSWSTFSNEPAFLRLCRTGTADAVRSALSAGENPNMRNEAGSTALMVAAANAAGPEVLAALLQAGADVNAKNAQGDTPLMAAAQWNGPEILALLLDAGADVEAKNAQGKSAANFAEKNGRLKGAEVLRRLGLDPGEPPAPPAKAEAPKPEEPKPEPEPEAPKADEPKPIEPEQPAEPEPELPAQPEPPVQPEPEPEPEVPAEPEPETPVEPETPAEPEVPAEPEPEVPVEPEPEVPAEPEPEPEPETPVQPEAPVQTEPEVPEPTAPAHPEQMGIDLGAAPRAIRGENVPLFLDLDPSSPPLTRLEDGLPIEALRRDPTGGWVLIRTPDGLEGWVEGGSIRQRRDTDAAR